MLLTTVTIDSDQTMEEAVVRMEGIPGDGYIIVRRRDGLDLYWYQFRAGFIREMAKGALKAKVIGVLNLREGGAVPSFQHDTLAEEALQPGIVLDGNRAVGVLTDIHQGSTTRGFDPYQGSTTRGFDPYQGSTTGGGGMEAPQWLPHTDEEMAEQSERRASWWFHRRGARRNSTLGRSTRAATTTSSAVSAAGTTFSAFSRLGCPPQVTVGQTFDLSVSLAAEDQADTAGGGVTVTTAAPEFDLVVQVVADGFKIDRVRDVLHVVRSDPSASEARFALTAEPIEGSVRAAILQVDFSFGGVLCGRAWRTVAVTQDSAPIPGLTPSTSSTPVLIAEYEDAPDLMIKITENDDSTQLLWEFITPHDEAGVPTIQVRTRFKAHNAKSFAMQQIRIADQSIGAAAVGNRMLGIARTIADEIPPEAWQALAGVWAVAKAKNELPSVLIVSSDPYVPWELASTEDAYIDSGLVDAALPSILGAQVRISRWMAPQPRGAAAVLNPPLPPPARLGVGEIVLVIGDYLAESGKRPLPKAIEEGDRLAKTYGAVRLTATLDAIDPLFDGIFERDGKRIDPNIVHFACHGQIDPNPGFNGIVLNEGNARLDPLYVAGNKMQQRPFVFLNACQIAQSTELLDNAGGMAAEFLKTGASGFVAPLWSVDDQVAQDMALGFYKAALDHGEPIAEVLRKQRARFDPEAPTPQMTHLAYVYYGHPRLVMARA